MVATVGMSRFTVAPIPDIGEESPDSIGQDVPASMPEGVGGWETRCYIGGDGKCHRKYTTRNEGGET